MDKEPGLTGECLFYFEQIKELIVLSLSVSPNP